MRIIYMRMSPITPFHTPSSCISKNIRGGVINYGARVDPRGKCSKKGRGSEPAWSIFTTQPALYPSLVPKTLSILKPTCLKIVAIRDNIDFLKLSSL